MSEQYLGEIRIVSFPLAPRGWALCNGQVLTIQQNEALFSILGTTYGGNGINTFGLPNLQGRVPLHVGSGFVEGQVGGEAAHTLTVNEMPGHAHLANAQSSPGSVGAATNALWATGSQAMYNTTPNTAMSSSAIASAGSSQAHENQPPYLVLNFIIALVGIFPSRN